MHSHRRRDARPYANCRLTHRCFARRIAHACASPKRRPIPASPPASSKPSAARTVASLTVLSPYTPAVCSRRRPPHSAASGSAPSPTPLPPIPAGLDARPITDGAALKQTLARAASGHVRDPAGARRTVHSAARRDPDEPFRTLNTLARNRIRPL
ncbi:hypothetical protein B0H14DRAFT_2785671 [Mycena olivaceomarginata]|nr:hypothetical protein B0H14DRAFT_2785671 [Mycena olivaceomarginata]